MKRFIENNEYAVLVLTALSVIWLMLMAMPGFTASVTSNDPCTVLVITTDDGKTIIREPRDMDYAFCTTSMKEETDRIPKTNRIFGKKCHKK